MEFHVESHLDKAKPTFTDNRNALKTLNFALSSQTEPFLWSKESKDAWAVKLKKIEASQTMIASDDFSGDNTMTHCGLMGFLAHAWAQEQSVELRPDMFWYTIVSGCVEEIIENTEKYRHLFSDKSEKQKIYILTRRPESLTVEKLDAALNHRVNNPKFKELICTPFESAPETYNTGIRMAFIHAAKSYFSFMTVSCGIPRIKVQGTKEEWQRLRAKTAELLEYFPVFKEQPSPNVECYYNRCLGLLDKFIENTFDSPNPKWFANIFTIDERCGSGHPHVVNGWIKDLYSKHYGIITLWPSHIRIMPWKDEETGRMFYKSIGMTRSVKKDGYWSPDYAGMTFEVTDPELFESLAK